MSNSAELGLDPIAQAAMAQEVGAEHAGILPALELQTAEQQSALARAWSAARSAGQLLTVTAATLPWTNEPSRLLAYGAALAYSPTPVSGALGAGIPTFLIGGLSGLAAAGLLESRASDKFIDLINGAGAKLHVPMDHNLSPASKAFWSFVGGVPVGMWLEQREDPSRTIEQNRKYALFTAAWQAGVLAVAGASGPNIIHKVVENPVGSLSVAAGLAAVVGAGVWAKRKITSLVHRVQHGQTGEQAQAPGQDYELYASLVNDYGKESPQHQGLTAADFETVLQDPRVVSTDIEVDGRRCAFPQLSPLEHYEWLNKAFYANKFPEAQAAGNLLHFTSLPSIEPGERVRDRLQTLADEEGVLVFDYPSSDPEYPQRVQALLDSLDIQGSDIEVIGTQTYFAGQTKLNREHAADEPVRGFNEAYSALVADGEYDHKRFANGASLRSAISVEEAEAMRRFYDKAYEVLNDHPCNQGLDPDQFYDMMTEQDWVTKIVNSRDGKVTALCLLTNELDDLSWVNADYYRRHFPDKAAKNQIFWFPGLAADPESTQRHNLQAMVNLIAQLGEKGNNDMLIVFDCCDMNTGFLDQALNYMINRTKEAAVDIQPIATQTYCAIRTSRKQ